MSSPDYTPIRADAAIWSKGREIVEKDPTNANSWQSYFDYINRNPQLVRVLNEWATDPSRLGSTKGTGVDFFSLI